MVTEEERKIEQGLMFLENIKARMAALEVQIESMMKVREEHERAKTTLEHYRNFEEGDEILVPIGGSTFISARMGEKKAIVGIGSGVSVGLPIEEAIKKVEERIATIDETINNLQEQMKALHEKYMHIASAVEREYRTLQEKAGGNV